MTKPSQVFVLRIDATAAEGNMFPAGERNELVVFIPAGSESEALGRAKDAIAEARWTNPHLVQVAILTNPASQPADPLTAEAIEQAWAGQQAIMVCGKP